MSSLSVKNIDRVLTDSATAKLERGESITTREMDAVRRAEKDREEELRWKYYESIPQKHWRQMSGRQTQILNSQAARYGLPVGGPVINLPKLARSLHDFLAKNSRKLGADDPLMDDGNSPALEEYRKERAALARLDRLQREGQLLPRDEAREALGRIAATIRAAGDTLNRLFGSGASDVLIEALDEAEAGLDEYFDSTHGQMRDAASAGG